MGRFRIQTALLTSLCVGLAFSTVLNTHASIEKRSLSGTSNVYLNVSTGESQHWASGILLGIPLNPDQIPDSWLSDIGFWNQRSGGSQLAEPCRGWTHGYDEFVCRYNSVKADWEVCKRHDCNFQIMLHDLWGTDTWPTFDATPMPGDNGSYVDFDSFLDSLFSLMEQDGISGNVWLDLWNEVDNVDFLNRGLARWLEYWGHAHHKIVASGRKTTGPSYGHLPNFAGDVSDWFSEWASFIKSNDSYPDVISMHFLYPDGDLTTSIDSFNSYLNQAGLPNYSKTWNIQEYGHPDQLFPSGAAWNIAQLERHDAWGLRANWLGGLQLHDFLANLLGKADVNSPTATGYWAAREYPVYQYYYQNMTGYRVATSMTDDTLSDTYATVESTEHRVRILSGCRPSTGVWYIQINELSAIGLPAAGTLTVDVLQFNSEADIFAQVSPPSHVGTFNYNYGSDYAIIAVYQDDPDVTYAFEFSY